MCEYVIEKERISLEYDGIIEKLYKKEQKKNVIYENITGVAIFAFVFLTIMSLITMGISTSFIIHTETAIPFLALFGASFTLSNRQQRYTKLLSVAMDILRNEGDFIIWKQDDNRYYLSTITLSERAEEFARNGTDQSNCAYIPINGNFNELKDFIRGKINKAEFYLSCGKSDVLFIWKGIY